MINQVATSGTVYLSATGTFTVNAVLNILTDKTITLIPHNGTATPDSGTVTLSRASGYNGALINVNDSGTLNLRNTNTNTYGSSLIIDGGAIWGSGSEANYLEPAEVAGNTGVNTATSAAVVVYGTMKMYTGVTIQNNHNTAPYAAATGAGAGGGVSIFGGGEFIMEGGTIQKNYAYNGGGVAINANNGAATTTFTMTGGDIKTNLADVFGGGVLSRANCTAVLSGGLISYNSINANTSTTYGCGWHAIVSSGCDFTGVTRTLITLNINQGTGGANLNYNSILN
jgi:hypothetical protein